MPKERVLDIKIQRVRVQHIQSVFDGHASLAHKFVDEIDKRRCGQQGLKVGVAPVGSDIWFKGNLLIESPCVFATFQEDARKLPDVRVIEITLGLCQTSRS